MYLGVVDQEVYAVAELQDGVGHPCPFPRRLVIADICDAGAIALDSVPNGGSEVRHGSCLHLRPTEREVIGEDLVEGDIRWEPVQGKGEIGGSDQAADGIAERALFLTGP